MGSFSVSCGMSKLPIVSNEEIITSSILEDRYKEYEMEI